MFTFYKYNFFVLFNFGFILFQACDLFLKVCSNLLKSQLKYVKRDGAMSTFVKKYSMVFFGTTIEITHEFLYKAFPNSPACSSGTIIS